MLLIVENKGKDKKIIEYINKYKTEKKKKQNEQCYKHKARKERDKYKEQILELEKDNNNKADNIKRLDKEFDEVHLLLEALVVTTGKKKRAELVNKFTFKKI
tara:strand:- start:284 stop:589 length:306 start_codon:yes stop_codon:yes gene_type:complete